MSHKDLLAAYKKMKESLIKIQQDEKKTLAKYKKIEKDT